MFSLFARGRILLISILGSELRYFQNQRPLKMEEDTSDQALFDLEQLETNVLRLMARRNGLSPEGERDSLLRRIKQKFVLEDSGRSGSPEPPPLGRPDPPPSGHPGPKGVMPLSRGGQGPAPPGAGQAPGMAGGDRKRRKPKNVPKRLTPQSKGVKDVPSRKKARSDKPDAGMISISSLPSPPTNCCIFFGKFEENIYLIRIYLAEQVGTIKYRICIDLKLDCCFIYQKLKLFLSSKQN